MPTRPRASGLSENGNDPPPRRRLRPFFRPIKREFGDPQRAPRTKPPRPPAGRGNPGWVPGADRRSDGSRSDDSCLRRCRPLAKADDDDGWHAQASNPPRDVGPVLGPVWDIRRGCAGELAPVPRSRKPRHRHVGSAAAGLGHRHQCGLAGRGTRTRMVLTDRLGKTGVPHHGGERRRTGGSEEGPVFRRRPAESPEAAPALDGPVPRPRFRQDPLEHRASRSGPDHAHPPQEQLRLRDAGHRRQTPVCAVRVRGPVLPRSPRQGRLVAADATPPDALRLGNLFLADPAPGPGLRGERQRGDLDADRLRRQDRQDRVASPAR